MPSTDGHLKIFYGMYVGLTAIQHCHIERRIECWGICIHTLQSHAPESIHVGFPFLPFCILAIVPVAPLCAGHFAPAIDTILAETIIATIAATTIMIVGLAMVKAGSFFCNIKRHGIICYKHYLC